MRWGVVIVALLWANAGFAADAIVKDGGTLLLGDTVFRLNGIDAPAYDQTCIDDHADPWACGVEARDLLVKLIGKRDVHCDDLGADDTGKGRRLGLCTAEGETASLNQLMVRAGFALNMEPSAKGRFKADETVAQDTRAGLWKGCFVAPQHFRKGLQTAPLFGPACRKDKDAELRALLFPAEPAMPPGCSIKAQYARRARFTGNVGIYHLQGCRSYPSLTKPNRWFCSEEDAQAAGFRRAFNCRGKRQ
ncbi:MAG: thermonuclease family protein [Xanthobacteraceae bacterium]|jgi:endonuclease YncB( thermonuclease family)